jgi:hypothetical protein
LLQRIPAFAGMPVMLGEGVIVTLAQFVHT